MEKEMTETIYLVVAEAGEYSYYSNWVVYASADKGRAYDEMRDRNKQLASWKKSVADRDNAIAKRNKEKVQAKYGKAKSLYEAFNGQLYTEYKKESDAIVEESKREIEQELGPPPKAFEWHEDPDHFFVVKVPLDSVCKRSLISPKGYTTGTYGMYDDKWRYP
jgi:hypothetical protein